jgi:hypothetical protein
MFKGMWNAFWGKLGDKERKAAKAIGGTVVVVAVLVVAGQMNKPKPDALTGKYIEATQQASKQLAAPPDKPAQ